jgi:translation initiation factor 1
MSVANDKIDNTVEPKVGKPDGIETANGANDTNVADPADSKNSDNVLLNLTSPGNDLDDLDNGAPSGIENLKAYDPFADQGETPGEEKVTRSLIHIRIQQRNGRKTLTTVQGIPTEFDPKKILKVIKKKFACNGTTVFDKELGEVIQLQGDQRKLVREFLIDPEDGLELDERDIKIHGF